MPRSAPSVGLVSLGCPKALFDCERILIRLRADGYAVSPDRAGAGTVPAPGRSDPETSTHEMIAEPA